MPNRKIVLFLTVKKYQKSIRKLIITQGFQNYYTTNLRI